MGGTLRNWRVPIAAGFALALITGSYLLARSVSNPPAARASDATELLQSIASRDSDSDGLPDWEEALYGTNPNNTDTYHLGMTDGQAVAQGLIVPKAIADVPVATSTPSDVESIDPSLPPPPADGTVTAAFAKNFFTLYGRALQNSPDGSLTDAEMNNVAVEALGQLAQSVTLAPDFKSAKDIKVEGAGPEALRTYAASAEAVFQQNKSSASKSEILYLKDAITDKDTSAIEHMASIARAYKATTVGLAVLPAPTELAQDHLALVNALARLSGIIEDFTRVNSDPIVTMLALQQYSKAVLNLGNAFIALSNDYKTANLTFAPGEPGASVVNLISNIAEKQKTGKQP